MSRWISKFQIGLQSDGFSSLKRLSDLIIADPNTVSFLEYTRIVGKNGMGQQLRVGFPIARLGWTWLPQIDIDTLKRYEGQDVYLRTETNEGALARRFRYFAGYAQFLQLGAIDRRVAHDGPNDGIRQRRAVTWEFNMLIPELGITDSFA